MRPALDLEIALVAIEHHGLFNRLHLAQLGISAEERRHRLEQGRWERVHDSAYRIAGSPLDWRAALLAACWAGGPRAAVSHRSAAALRDLPGGSRLVVELTCPRWRRARHGGLIIHESLVLHQEDIVLVDNIPCTTVERTLFDLAASGATTLDLAIDAALRRDLTSLGALRRQVGRTAKRGRAGSGTFRAAVDERLPHDATPESGPERLLAKALRRHGLPVPIVQHIVRDDANTFVARVDLAYPDDGILIEYDSFEHHIGKVAMVRDSARRNTLTSLGFVVLTATAADLRDDAAHLASAIRRVRATKA